MKITNTLIALTVLTLSAKIAVAQTAYIANSQANTVSVIDVTSGTVTGTIAVGVEPFGVSVSQDGNRVYVSNPGDATISVINTADNLVSATIPVDTSQFLCVTPDGNTLYASSGSSMVNTVTVINTATNSVLTTVTVGDAPQGITVSPDGTKVYVANYISNTVSVIATASNTVTATIPVGDGPVAVCVTPDGSKAYVSCLVSQIDVINTATNTVIATIPFGSMPSALTVSPDGSKVYVTHPGDGMVSVITTATNTISASIPVGFLPQGISITPDGTEVYAVNVGTDEVTVINTATNTVSDTIPVGWYPISNGNFISSYTQPASVSSFTSFEDAISVYPNPTNGEFNIVLPFEEAEISVSNLLGQELISFKTVEPTTAVELMEEGVYTISIKTKHGVATRKVVVN